jgi:hypothetical protein
VEGIHRQPPEIVGIPQAIDVSLQKVFRRRRAKFSKLAAEEIGGIVAPRSANNKNA